MRNKLYTVPLMLLSAFFLYYAVKGAGGAGNPFLEIQSSALNAFFLNFFSPGQSGMMAEVLPLLKFFVSSHVLPVFLLILSTTCLILFFHLSGFGEPVFFRDRETPGFWPAVCLLILIAGVLLLFYRYVFHFHAISTDEYSYLFQGEVLRMGRLYVDSPAMPEFFSMENVVSNGRAFSKYTIGWPILLALAGFIRGEFLLGAILTAFSLWLMFRISTLLAGKPAGLITAIMALFSPFFILNGGTYFPHTLSGVLLLFMVYQILLIDHRDAGFPIFLAGLAGGWLINVRPVDGILAVAGLLPLSIWILYRRENIRGIIKGLALFAVGLFPGLAILLTVNLIQTGKALTFAFNVYNPAEKWGMGTLNHGMAGGSWNTAISIMRSSFWTFPLAGIFGFISIFRRDRRIWLLSLPILLYGVFFFFYYSLGNFEMGSRYYYNPLLILLVLAGAGTVTLAQTLREKWNLSIFIMPFMIASSLFMLCGFYSNAVPSIKGIYAGYEGRFRWMKYGGEGRALSFVRNLTDYYTIRAIRNSPAPDTDENILLLYLSPDRNEELIRRYPGRKINTLFWDHKKESFIRIPYSRSHSPEDYIYASINYGSSLRDMKSAVATLIRGLEKYPENPDLLYNLGYAYFIQEKYAEALPRFLSLHRKTPDRNPQTLFFLGRCYGETGDGVSAVEYLRRFIEKAPDSPLIPSAERWIKKYTDIRKDEKRHGP